MGVGVGGGNHSKYGTTFDNQLLVIDKNGPTTGAVIIGELLRSANCRPSWKECAMIDNARLGLVRLANRMPLNLAAARFLEGRRAWDGEMAAISLMRWGMENGIVPQPTALGLPDLDKLEYQLLAMARWAPLRATLFLANPEALDEETELVQALAAEVDTAPTPQDAAMVLLEHLYNARVLTAP